MPSAFRRYLLPGLVFQSVVIAGGYGTGRELVEFFLTQGPLGGLLAIGVSTLIWSAVCMATFEFARRYRAFDYRHFFQHLLGRGWVLFEGCYLVLMVIVLAVIAAAAGTIAQEAFGLAYWTGVAAIMLAVAGLVLGGSPLVERFLAGWSFVLYALYVVFFLWCFRDFGDAIVATLPSEPAGQGWAWAGLRYAGYNLAVIPAVLITLRHHTAQRDTLIAGALAGPIAILPGLLFFLCMVGQYPAVTSQAIPANYLLEILGSRGFQIAFQIVLFGTLIETGAGLLHAVNERLSGVVRDAGREMPSWLRPAVAAGFLALGTALSQFGLIGLIAQGYGTLTLAIIAVYVIPMLTIGVWKMRAV
ncbi:MAG: hypothetical protein Q8L86_07630 [Vicinamibacterales bacterium]|nr:hypothetical protein [Vicinamibacterales bacterium]